MDEFIKELKNEFAKNFMNHVGTNVETKPHTMSFKTICETINNFYIKYMNEKQR